MKAAIHLIITVLISYSSFAAAQPVEDKNKIAKIYYTGEMQPSAVSRLVSAFDEVNKNNDVERIYLYINSYGGDMDAGLMAAAAVRSSAIPVTTVAMSTVGSSATIMFCAADDRRSLPEGSLFLHPASISHQGDVRPADVAYLEKETRRFNEMFKKTYRACTKLDDAKIAEILHSEYNLTNYSPSEAMAIGLISSVDKKIIPATYSYAITSSSN
ncbi:peptidase S14 [Enterobacter sp. Ap-916]|uniref:ATP-dependent Clp protease proteolytic subunit n=1 Tax=Enterobacteriaceae TaxID=543 RepID=UPI000272B0B8|nr:ATP-dependent Clp protease proteolytic subunit [Enterobacter sp. Ag1]EJF30516.1 peptidase S14, ClpP [Enterobacter sp. Ag1]NIF58156.1 peptidase S14 [Enterobacter sp. Ap-867]NIG27902.1 peptidase S14 [Enterobacter sp. Ap-916]